MDYDKLSNTEKIALMELAQTMAKSWNPYDFTDTQRKPFGEYVKKIIDFSRQIAAEICTSSP